MTRLPRGARTARLAVGRVPAPRPAAACLFGAEAMAAVVEPLAVVVAGRPTPQGSHAGFAIWSGEPCPRCRQKWFVRVHIKEQTGEHLKVWRQAVEAAAMAAMAGRADPAPLDGPLAFSMVFTLARPAATRFAEAPWGTPDWSKLVRATEDALVGAKAIKDDSRLVWCDYGGKTYPSSGVQDGLPHPGAVIRVRRFG